MNNIGNDIYIFHPFVPWFYPVPNVHNFAVGWGLLACPVGMWLSQYLNKWGYKICLAVLLIINSITMLTTASLDLTEGRVENVQSDNSTFNNDIRTPQLILKKA